MAFQVNFIDTNVLVEILEVPGMCAHAARYQGEFKERFGSGEKFVLPVATIVETGNHISQANGDRYAVAKRFSDLLRSALSGRDPFVVRELRWDGPFVEQLLAGNSTGEDFVQLAGAGRFGAGDFSILVERDLYVAQTNYRREQVRIWTAEAELGAYA